MNAERVVRPARFKPGTFDIWTKTGREQREGFIFGDWAIDYRKRNKVFDGDPGWLITLPGWYLTHLSTGFAAGAPLRLKRDAEFAVRRLIEVAPNGFWHAKGRWRMGVMPRQGSATYRDMQSYAAVVRDELRARGAVA